MIKLKDILAEGNAERDTAMVSGVADIVSKVKDKENRKDIANQMMNKFDLEDVEFNKDSFLKLSGINEGVYNPANIKAYYEALCKNEKVTPLPLRFGRVAKGGAALTFNPKTMKPLYISFDVNRMSDPEQAVIHEITHQIKLETEKDAYIGKRDQSAKFKKLENRLFEKYAYSKFSNILWKENKSIDEKLSVAGSAAREIIHSILPKTSFAAGDTDSQKQHQKMIDDLVKTLNKFYEKYNIDKKITL